jgi:SAM-dependent methyltransferase
MIVTCPFCQGKNSNLVMETIDYRFGSPGVFKFVTCQQCGLIYLVNPLKQSELKNLYLKNYQLKQALINKNFSFLRKVWWSINKENFADIDISTNKKRGKVLDIGFGQATTLLYLQKKGYDVYGVELNANLVQAAKNLNIKAFTGSLEKINFPKNYFEIIILSQVLEHTPKPKKMLQEVSRILAPGGKVFIYVPNANGYLSRVFKQYWHGWYAPFHYYVFKKRNLIELAQTCKLKVYQVKTYTPTNFFVTSLKAFFNSSHQPAKAKSFLDNPIIKLPIALTLRLFDLFFKGDCLKIVLIKE